MLNFDEIVKLSDAQAVADAVNGAQQARPAPQVETPEAEVQPSVPSFASFLEQSAAYRRQQSEAWEKREREAKSRKTIAAVSDALSSLGNLVGTAYGAAPQRQTYQMPFVQQDTEQERALARATAERLRNADQSYQMMLDRYAAQGELGDTRLAQEKERTNRALQVEGMRNERAAGNNATKAAIAAGRYSNAIKLKEMDLKYRGNRDKMLADLKREGIQVSRDKLDEMIRHNQTMEVINEKRGTGNVGGYKVVITRDQYGREVSRERIPTGGNAQTEIEWDSQEEDDNKIDW